MTLTWVEVFQMIAPYTSQGKGTPRASENLPFSNVAFPMEAKYEERNKS